MPFIVPATWANCQPCCVPGKPCSSAMLMGQMAIQIQNFKKQADPRDKSNDANYRSIEDQDQLQPCWLYPSLAPFWLCTPRLLEITLSIRTSAVRTY